MAGERPAAEVVVRILAEDGAASVTRRSHGDVNRLALLGDGLAFDLHGLAPGAPAPLPPARHFFGLADTRDAFPFEAITLAPGPDTAGGAAMLPLIAAMARVAAALAAGSSARVLGWQPAGTWMDPGYFARITESWLSGGAFPALGLTALVREEGGGVVSDGLAFFTGQELHVAPRLREHPTDTVKLAVRTIGVLVRDGPVTEARTFRGLEDEPLIGEPSTDGRIVRLLRD